MRRKVYVRVSLYSMLRLIRVDTLRRVDNAGFLPGLLTCLLQSRNYHSNQNSRTNKFKFKRNIRFLLYIRFDSFLVIFLICSSVRDVEFEGYCIPKGSILFGCFWSANHDETIWIDPWNFRPERFLDDKGKLLSVDHKLRKS